MKKEKLYISTLQHFLASKEFSPASFIFASLLLLLGAFLEGFVATLLIPVTKGIITMDFGFIVGIPIVKRIAVFAPFIFPSSNKGLFLLFIAAIFASVITKNVILYIAQTISAYQLRQFANSLRKLIFSRYINFGKMFFDRSNQGYLHSVLVHFTSTLSDQLIGLQLAVQHLFMLLVYFVMMFIISRRLTLFIIILFLCTHSSLRWLTSRLKKTSQSYANSQRELNEKIFNILSCIPLVKLYNQEENEKRNFADISGLSTKLQFSIDKKLAIICPIQEIMVSLALLLLVVCTALIIAKDRVADIAIFMVYFFLVKRASVCLAGLSQFTAVIASIKGPISKILEMLSDEGKFFVVEGKKEFPGLKSRIEFNRLNFAYVKGVPVLKDVAFSIEKGKMTAIVGPTGAGKTTLINLLLRFYDCPSSSIIMDGVDIREFSSKSLSVHMAFVSQETLLFDDTIRNNIVYGINRDIPNNQIMDVVKRAQLYDFVTSLPDGLETYVGDRGVKLSGGEKQRVSIARALIKDSEILMLDEATSSLDTKTEQLIQKAIEEVTKDRTTIVIAHRLSTIKNADKIVVIEEGRIIEQGSLSELLDRKGKFYQYWEAQKF